MHLTPLLYYTSVSFPRVLQKRVVSRSQTMRATLSGGCKLVITSVQKTIGFVDSVDDNNSCIRSAFRLILDGTCGRIWNRRYALNHIALVWNRSEIQNNIKMQRMMRDWTTWCWGTIVFLAPTFSFPQARTSSKRLRVHNYCKYDLKFLSCAVMLIIFSQPFLIFQLTSALVASLTRNCKIGAYDCELQFIFEIV